MVVGLSGRTGVGGISTKCFGTANDFTDDFGVNVCNSTSFTLAILSLYKMFVRRLTPTRFVNNNNN